MTDTDDEYGRSLGQHLQTTDPSPVDHQLTLRTVRVARGVRLRRRVAGAAALAVVAIAVPVAVVAGPGWLRQEPVPAGPVTARPSPDVTSPAGPRPTGEPSSATTKAKRVDVALAGLTSGAAPTVGVVRNGVWMRPNGTTTAVAPTSGDGYGGTFVPWGDGGLVAQVWRPGGDTAEGVVTAYGKEGGDPKVIDVKARDLVSGPSGSVWMVDAQRSSGTTLVLARWDADGVLTRFEVSVADAAAATFGVAGETLFVADDTTTAAWYLVGDGQLSGRTELAGIERIGTADTAASSVVLWTTKGCSAVLETGSMKVAWTTCDYTVTAFSLGGRYAYGTSVGDASGPEGAILDNRTGRPLLRLANAEAGAFDAFDQVNVLAVGQADEISATHAVAVCTIAGACHRGSDPVSVPTNSGRHALDLVG